MLGCPISFFLFSDTKWIHHIHLSGSLVIPFFQNCEGLSTKYCSRFLFRIWTVYREEKFLITGTSNKEEEYGMIYEEVEGEEVYSLRMEHG